MSTSPTEYAAAHRAASAASVATGKGPLLRTQAPGALRVQGEPPDIYWCEGRHVRSSAGPADPARLVEAVRSGSPVAVADGAALRSIGRWLRESGVERAKMVAAAMEASAAMPVGKRVVVIASALRAKFWAPRGGVADWRAWAPWFDIAPEPPSLRSLVEKAYEGSAIEPEDRLIARTDDGPFIRKMLAGRSEAVNAFHASVALSDRWSHILRVDRIARAEHCLTGDVVALRPRDVRAGVVTAEVPSPCKLREGPIVIFDDHRSVGATLRSLDYDSGMLARIRARPAAPGRRQARSDDAEEAKATSMIYAAIDSGATLWATSPNQGGQAKSGSARRWTDRAERTEPRGRQVPLYVSLAGAVES